MAPTERTDFRPPGPLWRLDLVHFLGLRLAAACAAAGDAAEASRARATRDGVVTGTSGLPRDFLFREALGKHMKYMGFQLL